MVPVVNARGETQGVTRPLEPCANGHPWAPATGAYREKLVLLLV
jgi:hypothetical protein